MISSEQATKISNLNISDKKVLIPAECFIEQIPVSKESENIIVKSRLDIENVIHSNDDRIVVIVGPCSIHDTDSAIEYAQKLKKEMAKHKNELVIIMRVYFEKPRTTIGWKGLINDPNLNGTYDINKGLKLARTLLSNITNMGVPCSTEFLDVITPQYLAELVSWGAIGARTVESQVHRELASGLSCPIGFKNATNGDTQVAVDAVSSATYSHHFISSTKSGASAIFKTKGNKAGHVILRGGTSGPNYEKEFVDVCVEKLQKANLPEKIMIDCSHGNSSKDYKKQKLVLESICEQIKVSDNVFGVMIESNLKEGKQDINNKPLEYGKSVTDACVSFEETEVMLEMLANAVKAKRANK